VYTFIRYCGKWCHLKELEEHSDREVGARSSDRDTSTYDSLLEEQTKSDKLLPSNFRRRLKEMLGGLGVALGSDEYNRFMTTIDNDTLQQLQQLLSD
jgi:hypothetical protein